jgi:hypothetical protein
MNNKYKLLILVFGIIMLSSFVSATTPITFYEKFNRPLNNSWTVGIGAGCTGECKVAYYNTSVFPPIEGSGSFLVNSTSGYCCSKPTSFGTLSSNHTYIFQINSTNWNGGSGFVGFKPPIDNDMGFRLNGQNLECIENGVVNSFFFKPINKTTYWMKISYSSSYVNCSIYDSAGSYLNSTKTVGVGDGLSNSEGFIAYQDSKETRVDTLCVYNITGKIENDQLTSTIINDCGSISSISSPDTLNISSTVLPNNNNQFNYSTFSLNTTVSASYSFNCSLYLNSTLNQTITGYSAGSATVVNFTKTFTDGAYTHFINCYDNTTNENSTTKTFFIDTTAPSVTTNLAGLYVNNYFNLTLNATDTNLKYFNLTSSCAQLNYSNASITSSPHYKNMEYDLRACNVGTYTANIVVCDAPNNTILNCVNNSYTYYTMATLNITAYSNITGSAIQNFTIYLNGTLLGSTTTYNLTVYNLSLIDYNLSIDAATFALTSKLKTINATTNSLNFSSLYNTNSILFTILDESTGAAVTENITIKFTTNSTEFTNTSNLSYFYISSLNVTEYLITFSSTTYQARTYTITIGNRSYQTLTAYLTNSTSQTLFTVIDADNSEVLSNTLSTMYKIVGGSWVPVESKYTDITGKVLFSYVAGTNYRFYLSKTGYEPTVFTLSPILFATYDIKMTKSTSINYSQDYDKLSVIYSPSYFTNGTLSTFYFLISSPYGTLVSYSVKVTEPGGATNSSTGVNAIGEQINLKFTPNATSVFDTVRVDYSYITTLSGLRNFTVLLPVNIPDSTGYNNTFMANIDRTYGLGIFERILIATLVVLMVAGIATMVGQPIPGLALGLFIFGYMAYIGFIPLWAILPSMFIGFMFLTWKSGGY